MIIGRQYQGIRNCACQRLIVGIYQLLGSVCTYLCRIVSQMYFDISVLAAGITWEPPGSRRQDSVRNWPCLHIHYWPLMNKTVVTLNEILILFFLFRIGHCCRQWAFLEPCGSQPMWARANTKTVSTKWWLNTTTAITSKNKRAAQSFNFFFFSLSFHSFFFFSLLLYILIIF